MNQKFDCRLLHQPVRAIDLGEEIAERAALDLVEHARFGVGGQTARVFDHDPASFAGDLTHRDLVVELVRDRDPAGRASNRFVGMDLHGVILRWWVG